MIDYENLEEKYILLLEKYKKSKEQNKQLLFFGDFCSSLLSHTDIEKISQLVVEQMKRFTGGHITFVRKEAVKDYYAVYTSEGNELKKESIHRKELGAKYFFIYCKRIYLGNVSNPFVAIPIKYEGENLGVVILENLEIQCFHRMDLKLLELVALPIGVAVKNCILLQQSIIEKQTIVEQHHRMEEDLQFAQKVQSYLMPRGYRKYGNYSFYANHLQARYLGGDFYDIFQIDERKVIFYIADVSGHGVAASLVTVFLKQAIRGIVQSFKKVEDMRPSQILEKLQIRFRELQMDETVYIGVLVGILDLNSQRILLANGGHNVEPILAFVNQGKNVSYNLKGFPINNWQLDPLLLTYEETVLSLGRDDKLILMTDGATELQLNKGQRMDLRKMDVFNVFYDSNGKRKLPTEFNKQLELTCEELRTEELEDDFAILVIHREA